MLLNTLFVFINSIMMKFFVFFFCCFHLFLVSDGEPQICDSNIQSIDNDYLKYQKRSEDRGEGFYRAEVSLGAASVVGLIYGKFYFGHKNGETLRVTSPFIRTHSIFVRSVGIPLKTYYRMDGYLNLVVLTSKTTKDFLFLMWSKVKFNS